MFIYKTKISNRVHKIPTKLYHFQEDPVKFNLNNLLFSLKIVYISTRKIVTQAWFGYKQ